MTLLGGWWLHPLYLVHIQYVKRHQLQLYCKLAKVLRICWIFSTLRKKGWWFFLIRKCITKGLKPTCDGKLLLLHSAWHHLQAHISRLLLGDTSWCIMYISWGRRMCCMSFGTAQEGKERCPFRKESSSHENTALHRFYFSKSALGLYWTL